MPIERFSSWSLAQRFTRSIATLRVIRLIKAWSEMSNQDYVNFIRSQLA
jgi:hypothetical protein